MNGVVYVTKVTAGFAITVNVDRLVLDHGGDPLGDNGSVGAIRVLPAAEDIEVAQADALEAVGTGKDLCVKFVDQLGDGVGAEGLAYFVFNLGQVGVVAVCAAASGVDEAFDVCFAGGDEHVEETVDIVLVGGDRVFDAAGYGAKGGLVENVVNCGGLRTVC